jgi:hypothetical protein
MPTRDLFLGSQPKHGAGYNPRPVALPAPTAGRHDAPVVCLRVNVEWYAHLLGVLRILEHPLAWSGTDQEKRAAVSEITTLLNGVECEDGLQDIRVTDCTLQKTFDGTNWINVVNLHDCSDDISQIIDGLSYDAGQGTRYEGGGDFTIVNMPDLSAGGHDGPCRAGHWVQGEIEDGLDNALSIVDAATDVATAIGEIITVLGAPGWILDYMIPWVTSAVDLGVAVIRSQLSTELWDSVICAVTCNIDDSLTINDDIRELIAIDVSSGGTDAAYDVVAWYIRSLSLEHWQYLLWRAQFSPTTVTCGFCSCSDDYDVTVIFTSGGHGWVFDNTGGTEPDKGTIDPTRGIRSVWHDGSFYAQRLWAEHSTLNCTGCSLIEVWGHVDVPSDIVGIWINDTSGHNFTRDGDFTLQITDEPTINKLAFAWFPDVSDAGETDYCSFYSIRFVGNGTPPQIT